MDFHNFWTHGHDVTSSCKLQCTQKTNCHLPKSSLGVRIESWLRYTRARKWRGGPRWFTFTCVLHEPRVIYALLGHVNQRECALIRPRYGPCPAVPGARVHSGSAWNSRPKARCVRFAFLGFPRRERDKEAGARVREASSTAASWFCALCLRFANTGPSLLSRSAGSSWGSRSRCPCQYPSCPPRMKKKSQGVKKS